MYDNIIRKIYIENHVNPYPSVGPLTSKSKYKKLLYRLIN